MYMMMCGGLKLTLQYLDEAQLALEEGQKAQAMVAVVAAERSLKFLGPLASPQTGKR